MSIRTRALAVAAVAAVAGALVLSGCSAPASAPAPQPSRTAEAAAPVPSPTPSASDTAATVLSQETLAGILTDIDFDPKAFTSTSDMFGSVYPGVTVSPPCLALLGVGFEKAPDVEGGAVAFGPSIDRTLTAVITSVKDEKAAEFLYKKLELGIDACIKTPGVTFKGTPVDATVERTGEVATGADQGEGLRLSTTVMGTSTTVIGQVSRAGNDVVVVVGWDPKTNATNVPMASRMLVKQVVAAH